MSEPPADPDEIEPIDPSDVIDAEPEGGRLPADWIWIGGIAAVIALVVTLVVGLILGPALVARSLPPAPADPAPRLAAIEARLAESEQLAGQIGRVAADLQALDGRLEALDQRLAAVNDAISSVRPADTGALEAELAALDRDNRALADELAGLRSQVGDLAQSADLGVARDREAGVLLLAVGQLRNATAGGAPFADALAPLADLLARDPAATPVIERLRPIAATGVPTAADLRDRFPDVATDLIHAERLARGDGWLNQAAAELGRLVTVRPVGGEVEGDTVGAVVARAEAHLSTGDLAGALSEIERLGELTAAAQPWLDQARARRDLDAALTALTAIALDTAGTTPDNG